MTPYLDLAIYPSANSTEVWINGQPTYVSDLQLEAENTIFGQSVTATITFPIETYSVIDETHNYKEENTKNDHEDHDHPGPHCHRAGCDGRTAGAGSR